MLVCHSDLYRLSCSCLWLPRADFAISAAERPTSGRRRQISLRFCVCSRRELRSLRHAGQLRIGPFVRQSAASTISIRHGRSWCQYFWSTAEESSMQSMSVVQSCLWARKACLPSLSSPGPRRRMRVQRCAVQEEENSRHLAKRRWTSRPPFRRVSNRTKSDISIIVLTTAIDHPAYPVRQ